MSTKELKKLTELQGKMFQAIYNRSMSELFRRFLIVGFGEVEDGAFPSLAVGSTRLLYEDLWQEASELDDEQAQRTIDIYLPEQNLFRKSFEKTLKSIGESGRR